MKNQAIISCNMKISYYPLINKILAAVRLRKIGSLVPSREVGFPRPFITVARDPGSGGCPIAKRVADKLGFLFVDEQIIEQIAGNTKQRKAIIKAIDEKSRTRIEDIVHSTLNKEYVDDYVYISELIKVILAYAHKGHVVILGRGANFICPTGKGLHANVTAPYNIRVQRAMNYEGFDKKQAKDVIAKVEKERKDFVKQYFKKNVHDVNAYDLTINTSYLDIDEAAQLIVDSFYKKFPAHVRLKAVFSS